MAEKKKLSVAEILAAAQNRFRQSWQRAERNSACGDPRAKPRPPVNRSRKRPLRKSRTNQNRPRSPRSKRAAQLSVAEMMAAARAEKKDGGTAPAKPAAKPAAAKQEKPAAKPAAAKPPPKAAPAAPVAAAPKDTGSILAEARNPSKPGPMTKAEAAAQVLPGRETRAAESWSCRRCRPSRPTRSRNRPRRKLPTKSAAVSWPAAVRLVLGARLHVDGHDVGLWTLGTARFMFPNILTEPPSQFKVGFPSNFAPGQVETKFVPQYGVWVVQLRIQRAARDLRPEDRLHAPGLHAQLARGRAEIQMPLPRQRLLQGRHQLRRSGPAAARALRDPRRATTASWKSTRARPFTKNSANGATRLRIVPV